MLILIFVAVTAALVIVCSTRTLVSNRRITRRHQALSEEIGLSYDAVSGGRMERIEADLADIKDGVADTAGPAARLAGLTERLDEAVASMPNHHHTAA